MSGSGALESAVAPVVRCLVETVISAELGRDDLSGLPHVDEAVEVMMHKLMNMPTHLSWGMQGMTLFFDAAGAFGGGRPFRMKSMAARRKQLHWMKGAPVGVLRDFAAFYEKMGSFSYYSLIEESHGHLPAPAPEAR